MKKIIQLVCLSVVAVGCASPNQLRESGPVADFKSTRPAMDVARCILDRWENSGIVSRPVAFRPTKSGYSIAIHHEAFGIQLMADVHEADAGSITKYFKGTILGEGSFDEAVSACQN